MKLRGNRECAECGTQWSYFETGAVVCPECDSPRSRAVDGGAEHTAGTATLDLSPVRAAVDERPVTATAEAVIERTRPYLASRGFVAGGELQPLDDRYLVATELHRVGTTLRRDMRVSDAEAAYLLELLRAADAGDRPSPDAVPEALHPERGLAVTAAVETYCTDLRRVLGDGDRERALTRALSTITANRKRIEALDGAVDRRESERLVRATRDLGQAVREESEEPLARVPEYFE